MERKVAKRNQAKGNRLERDVAKITGGVQIGDRGGCDVYHPLFNIECKNWNEIPKKVRDAWSQAKSNARGKQAMLVVHEGGSNFLDSLVTIDMRTAINLNMFKVVSVMTKLDIEIDEKSLNFNLGK